MGASKREHGAEDQHPESERRRERRELFWNAVFLLAAVVYTLSPMDIIPDVLGPFGFSDDILLWAILLGAGLLKRFRRRDGRS